MSQRIPEHIVQQNLVRGVYLAPMHVPFGRDVILHWLIEFDFDFKCYVLAVLRQINPDISELEFDNKGIFAEPQMLSSLSKCIRFAKVLNIVSADEFHDIDKLVKLRNKYAHGRNRTALDDDPDATAIVLSMKLFLNNKDSLVAMSTGHIFLSCVQTLSENVKEKTSRLNTQ